MKKYLFILLLFSAYNRVNGQVISHIADKKTYETIPAEKIYLHYNTSLLFSGDYLYFKMYCLEEPTLQLSKLSKIGYVILINEKKEKVFSQKVYLENGEGSGDFFIDTKVPSGKYKLISYTNWMQNNEENNYFQADICIINPFQENQSVFTSKSSGEKYEIEEIKQPESQGEIQILELKTDKKVYGKREQVTVEIASLADTLCFGKYSISVRKKLPLKTPQIIRSPVINSITAKKKNIGSPENKNIHLPEMRGELIHGKIINKSNNTPASDVPVAFSIPGNNFVFKVASTNKDGIFYLNIENKYLQNQAVIEIMNSKKDSSKVVFEPYTEINYDDLSFSEFSISAKDKDLILQHSIFNQIENAYGSIRTDSSLTIPQNPVFFGTNTTTYQLDDYTRFPTIKETIVEIVNKAYITQSKGKSYLNVRIYDENTIANQLPLVLVDGVFISNHEILLGYNARRIKSILVFDEKYFYSGEVFAGIISFETLDGAYVKEMVSSNDKFDLFKPTQQKTYFVQKYNETGTFQRIPDYRSQLLWEPQVFINKKNNLLSFYTSENNGDFEISLEGFTNTGKPVSLSTSITVD
jgi:hypothetical protein